MISLSYLYVGIILPAYANEVLARTTASTPKIFNSTTLKGHIESVPEYTLGPGDVLEIFDYITKENETFPQVIQTVPILPDGTATIVPIGQIRVEGLTLNELNKLVRDELSKTIKSPKIFVTVAKTKTFDIYVVGAVNKPGHYNGTDFGGSSETNRLVFTVSSVLEIAGGLRNTANVKDIVIHRKNTNETFHVDLWKLISEGDIAQDITLQNGDVILVQEANSNHILTPEEQYEISRSTLAAKSIKVQVLGAVRSPGVFELPADSDFVTAIARAGGPEKNAANKVFLARVMPDGSISKQTVDFKGIIKKASHEKDRIKLLPNDVIYVEQSALKQFSEFTTNTSKGLVSSFSTAILFNLINNK